MFGLFSNRNNTVHFSCVHANRNINVHFPIFYQTFSFKSAKKNYSENKYDFNAKRHGPSSNPMIMHLVY